jgi:hypothetical protein
MLSRPHVFQHLFNQLAMLVKRVFVPPEVVTHGRFQIHSTRLHVPFGTSLGQVYLFPTLNGVTSRLPTTWEQSRSIR